MILPGGSLIAGAGGYLQLWNWSNASGTGASPTPCNYRYLDVARYEIHNKRSSPPLWYSGCQGAMRRRTVALDWSVYCRVWWDYQHPPDMLLTLLGDGLAVKLTIGDDSSWTGDLLSAVRQPGFVGGARGVTNPSPAGGQLTNGLGILPAGASWIPCYCAPLCVWSAQNVFDSSDPDEDGIVYQDLLLDGDSLLWYLPSQAVADAYAAYVGQIAQQGFIPNN